MSDQEAAIEELDYIFELIKKAQINFKKCPTTRKTKGYLQSKIQCIDEYWASFRSAHQNLFKITTRNDRNTLEYFVNDKHGECEEFYTCLKADLTDCLLSIRPNEESSVLNTSTSSDRVEKNIPDVKLPQINLPTFSGAYEEWQSFEDTFISLIHSNKGLSDVQRLHYLKSCVVGEAKNTIKHFQITEKNYKPAWDNLKNRYSHKRLIVNAILKRLFNLKKVNVQSPTQLKTLIDNTKECLTSLNALNIYTGTWDPIIIFLVIQKLDQESHRAWESYVSGEYFEEMPTFANFITFLESRICTLELTSQITTLKDKVKEKSFHATTTTHRTCIMCKENHLLCHCKEFGKLDPEKRSEFIKQQRLCYNCLAAGHPVLHCKQKTSCRICGRRHHSLLHSYKKRDASLDTKEKKTSPGLSSMHTNVEEYHEDERDVLIASHFVSRYKRALLATALVPIRSASGQVSMLRALIDSGSQASFVSERATQTLRLRKTSISGTVTGVGSSKTSVKHVVKLELLSRYEDSYSLNVKAYVISTQLTTKLPCKSIKPRKWSHLDGLTLADPDYFMPGKIDLLLGIDVYTEILKNNLIKGPPGTPCAQETNLGWILFGSINDQQPDEETIAMHIHLDVENMLRNMWDIEQSDKRNFTAEEKMCEEIYANSHSRAPDGRYIVKLPFKCEDPIKTIGDTKETALQRFHQYEKRLEKNPRLKEACDRVIEEYLELEHMEEVPEEELDKEAVFLPYHPVIREGKETTSVRLVFDASCEGSKNKSLNSLLLVGPQLQNDLRDLIMRWRLKAIAFVADIEKMYRQILVTKEDADFQRILWRKNTTDAIKQYRLLRVTFGISSAPYLAVKTLLQLAEDEGNQYPAAATIIKEDFFVDDCMSGCVQDSVKESVELSNQVTQILEKGGFILQKWASNNIEFMNEIQPSRRSINTKRELRNQCVIKTLGITWNMGTDSFHYHFNLPPQPQVITKRNILADIQRLFDPLGWLGAAIIPAKILIQQLWVENLDWDEEVTGLLRDEWIRLRLSYEHLDKVHIDRQIRINNHDLQQFSLHGFCDASNKAYCAVIYYRVVTKNGEIETGIVASKTRVAPVKPVTLPRLELCGAVLLARLLTQVRRAMRIPINQVYAWTDSSVVLSWLFGNPNRWKPFVSNRVVEILDNTHNTQWFHVVSRENPADIGSRGHYLPELVENQKLWWEGPNWLKEIEIKFTRPNVIPTEIERKKNIEVNVKIQNEQTDWFDNFDTLEELQRVIVYSTKFINYKRNPEGVDKHITTAELEEALLKCIIIVQRQEYAREIESLKVKNIVKKDSCLKSLNPYLDDKNILRVGGRLRNADLDNQLKHPIILGTRNKLISLIIAQAHRKTLHGGIQLMLCYLRTKYWIIRAKNAVKNHIRKCITCCRQKAVNRTQIMGDLPKQRVTEARPFLHSGVDFAGPLQVLMSKGRGAKSNKAYIAIFVCMAVKAIHLELVGDLTSESFVGAFRRFVARRGKCSHLWSDQGRNFIGANKELATAWREANLELPGDLVDILAADGTQWHYIPAYSPTFGGVWEAGVKSVKFHLKRVLTASLTFEEMTTTLCQIEACLNSRPLTPIDTTDSDVIEPLTPGHFLIGESPVSVPSPDLRNININRLSRWQFTQKLVRDFWHRWQSEYLSRLQERPKWLKRQKEFEIGDIVLLKDELTPPSKWALGRVVEKYPGPDGACRVYGIWCNKSVTKRSVTKLCALPIDAST